MSGPGVTALVLSGWLIAPQIKVFGKLDLSVYSEATFHRATEVEVVTHNVRNEKGRLATAFYLLLHILYCMPYGTVTVFPARVTAVCACSLPLTVAPVPRVIAVLSSNMPSKCAVVPMFVPPETTQKTFWGSTPTKIIFVAAVWLRIPAIWKIKTSVAEPVMVLSPVRLTPLVQV